MSFLNRFFSNTSQAGSKFSGLDFQQIIDEVNSYHSSLQFSAEMLEKITIDEVNNYFKNARPDMTDELKGALICQKHPEGEILDQVFLDKNNKLILDSNEVPIGRRLIIQKLDKQLSKILEIHKLALVNLNDEDFNLQKVQSLLNTDKSTEKSRLTKVFKILSIIIWSIVILLVILPLLGRLVMTQALGLGLSSSDNRETTQYISKVSRKSQIFEKALDTAYNSAEQHAKNELEKWEEGLIEKIDTDFLNWYFNYFNQKKQEISILFKYLGENFINGFDQALVNDKVARDINDNIQREFSRRVLQSESAERKFKVILTDTTKIYISELSTELKNVPRVYNIPENDWNQYLKTLQTRLENEKGNEVAAIELIGGVTATKLATQYAAKVAAKTGSIVLAKIGSFIEPAVGIGLLVYDYIDYTNGVKEHKPRLRKDLVQSLHDLKNYLLNDPQYGVMAGVNELEEKIKSSILQSRLPA
ncbi:MAG: hypothetical protein LRZ84_12370 [Desertifilum sp.]|nr:hypothetical protein [Desertifilum sp.]MDI9640232.1 hypothetical protein [Geitlerinema splendidum]